MTIKYLPPLVASDPEVWPAPIDYGEPLVGVRYTLLEARTESKRLRLSLDLFEPYRSWCEQQEPVLDELNSTDSEQIYGCVPSGDIAFVDGACYLVDEQTEERTLIDCGKYEMCRFGGICECDESSCTAPRSTQEALDGALEDEGDLLVGTLVGSGRATVRLERQ